MVGPGADGARLEGSKSWMKSFLSAAGVPTARSGTFDDPGAAAAFIREFGATVVVKTDGLAAGKGVLVTDDLEEAVADAASGSRATPSARPGGASWSKRACSARSGRCSC